KKKEELGRQGRRGPVSVELFEEGVFLRLFQQGVVIEGLGQAFGEGGFADADGAFDGDKAGQLVLAEVKIDVVAQGIHVSLRAEGGQYPLASPLPRAGQGRYRPA